MSRFIGIVSAYAYAVSQGYTGTEEEFSTLMASYATVAEEAAESAESASQSATQAGASAQTATTKASEASQSATQAGTKASQASTSATQASASATSASQSASTATAKASEASASASTASTKASEASTSATTASTKASEASQSASDAQTAQGLAESARDDAVDAKTDAESARDLAQQYAESINPENIFSAYPTDTASGAVASFADGADDIPMKSVKVAIEPVQDLHGREAPYPAGGGKNLFDSSVYSNYLQSDGSFLTTGSDVNSRKISIPQNLIGQELTFSAYCKIPNESTITYLRVVANVNGVVTDGNRISSSDYDRTTITFTPVSADDKIWITYGSNPLENLQFKDVQLEIGNTATDYAPYSNICPISGWTGAQVSHSGADRTNPTTYSITFPTEAGTVYGGVLDVTNGTLTVDRAMVDLESLDYAQYDSNNWRWNAMISNMKSTSSRSANLWSDRWHATQNAATSNEGVMFGYLQNVYFYTSDSNNTPTGQLVYELATPITYTLTPTEIKSLLGDNNIWADAGDTEVTYRADTKLYIEKKLGKDAPMIADSNIVSGSYFMVGSNLYKATANIANGAAVVVGTNAVAITMAEALNEINA